jgi:hypothetical protein
MAVILTITATNSRTTVVTTASAINFAKPVSRKIKKNYHYYYFSPYLFKKYIRLFLNKNYKFSYKHHSEKKITIQKTARKNDLFYIFVL